MVLGLQSVNCVLLAHLARLLVCKAVMPVHLVPSAISVRLPLVLAVLGAPSPLQVNPQCALTVWSGSSLPVKVLQIVIDALLVLLLEVLALLHARNVKLESMPLLEPQIACLVNLAHSPMLFVR